MLESEAKRAYVFPGQGTQQIGMSEYLVGHRNPDVATLTTRIFEEANDVLGTKLSTVCLEGPDTELDKPEITQPAILVTSIAALRALGYYGLKPDVVAGHSLGEYSALVAAESLSFEQAVRLVYSRGLAMQRAGEINPGGMAAVLGLSLPEVEEICRQSGAEVANVNSDKQIVISGNDGAITYTVEQLGERKVKRLRVKIGSHSSLMEPARQEMEMILQGETIQDPNIPFVQNVTADYATSGEQVRRGLVDQMTGRVLWLDSIRLMSKDGINSYIEVGSGEVLSGLIKRIDPNSETKTSRIALQI